MQLREGLRQHASRPPDAHPPRISVIIPTLREEAALARTLAQFTPEIRRRFSVEIVVSDGGSTDCTLPIARGGADTVVEGCGRQTIAGGRNAGARAARGEIFIFLNADVVIETPEPFFTKMIAAAARPEIAAATCNVNIYPAEATVADVLFHNTFNGYFWLLNLLGMGMGRGECHVMRREIFEASGGYDEKIAAGEDYEFFLRLGKRGKICFVRSLTVFESPRRFRRYGYFRITLLWFLNGLSVFCFRRSLSTEWKPVR